MIRLNFQILIALLFLVGGMSPATAEKRTAFLLGNGAYAHAANLQNPSADVRLIGGVLESLDFDVTLHENLTRAEIGQSLSQFLDDNENADVTFVYLAGHGMQFEGRNYFLGTDAKLSTEFDIPSETTPIDAIIKAIQKTAHASLIFVDACRDNPLANAFYQDNFSESRALQTRGLVPLRASAQGAMVVFSASPGQVAYDGAGANSPFAASVARHLDTPNSEILSVMKRVIGDVKLETEDKQIPIINNDLATEIYLRIGEGEAGQTLAFQREQALYEAVREMNSLRGWSVFLDRFPDSQFAGLAEQERDALARSENITVANLASESTDRGSDQGTLGLSVADIRLIQTKLATLGYDAGIADGVMGDKTRKSIADFQQANQLPSTGIMTEFTVRAMDIDVSGLEVSTIPIYSSLDARKWAPDALVQVETDPRLIRAAEVLKDWEILYGWYGDHLYIGVLAWRMKWPEAQALAERAGGYLAVMGDAEENDFVYQLVSRDDRFWQVSNAGQGRHSYGPTFGFYQKKEGREPDGGWSWVNDQPVSFTNWAYGNPNNGVDYDSEYATFYRWTKDMDLEKFTGNEWNDVDLPRTGRAFIIEIE
ncbi:caspase family protein [uncultured Tateyamaria sp.]|uniref:caspase family protein n=1 Tax=uncultured Tateyamaria sp. TaxID=455651 RepID=UPI002639FE8F|nr:caspase family protein [uncultured Tateyamaria sp.]